MHEVVCHNLAKKTVLELGMAWMFGRMLSEGERGDVVPVILADGSTKEGKEQMKVRT